jgi:hypothetical protein
MIEDTLSFTELCNNAMRCHSQACEQIPTLPHCSMLLPSDSNRHRQMVRMEGVCVVSIY